MTSNLKIAFRHLWNNKLFSVINILGLALGLASCFIIVLHVKYESGFDRFHVNKDRIIRVVHENYSYTPIVMGNVMPDYFPEIDKVVRVGKFDWTRFYVLKDNEFTEEKNLVFTDSSFFDVFSFGLLSGDRNRVLRAPDRILLSESMARKYFGNSDPGGREISFRIMNETRHFTIEGVFADFPEQSHFHANFIISIEFFRNLTGGQMFDHWGSNSVHTYLLMKREGMMESMAGRMQGFIDKYVPRDFSRDLHYDLQPLTRIHLYSVNITADIEPQGSITRVRIFTSIAILVLVIALVNFVMLSLALSYQRIKEFGVRKIVGARQQELVSLVTFEFLIVFLLAAQIALMLVELTGPVLERRMAFNIQEGLVANAGILLLFLAVAFVLGYLASIYVTINVSRIRPMEALKNVVAARRRWMPSRGALVVFQFSIMMVLMVSLVTMQKQLWLLRNKDLGFEKEKLLTFNIPYNSGNKYQILKAELKNNPGVESVSGAVYVPPGTQRWTTNLTNPETNEKFEVEEIDGDYDLVETLKIKILQGRAFSREFRSDTVAILINESAVKKFGLKDPVGSVLIRDESDSIRSRKQIIGVFRDFHIRSMYEEIHPMVLFLVPEAVQQMTLRIAAGDTRSAVQQIEKKWSEIFPDDPIQYYFVDEALRLNYIKEDQSFTLITVFALLSLFIALLGLFGLSAFAVERRTKETGIRKVNGAGVSAIFYALSKQFAMWILIAFIVAVPASWFAIHRWLQHFAYRTGIAWWVFLVVLLVSFVVAGITIGWQTYRAATGNPVDALRYE